MGKIILAIVLILSLKAVSQETSGFKGYKTFYLTDGILSDTNKKVISKKIFSNVNYLGCGMFAGYDSLKNIHFIDRNGTDYFTLKRSDYHVEEGESLRTLTSGYVKMYYFPNLKLVEIFYELVKSEPSEGDIYVYSDKSNGKKFKLYVAYYDLAGNKVIKETRIPTRESALFVCPNEYYTVFKYTTPKPGTNSITSEVKTQDEIAPESGITSKIVVVLLSKSSSSSLSVTKQTFSGLAVNAYQTTTTKYTNTQYVGIWKKVHCFNKTKESILKDKAPKMYELGPGDEKELSREYSDFKKSVDEGNVVVYNSYDEMLNSAKAKGIVKLFRAREDDYFLIQLHSKENFQVSNYDMGAVGIYSGGMKGFSRHGSGTLNSSDRSISGAWNRNEPSGQMTVSFKNGEKYIGETDERHMQGYGTYYYSNGDVFEGEFSGDKRNGKGEYRSKDGTKKKGFWAMGVNSQNADDIAHAKFISSVKSNSSTVNSAIRFVAGDGFFFISNNPSHKIDSTFTMEMWVRVYKSYEVNLAQNLVACLGNNKGYSLKTSNGSVFFQYYNNGSLVSHYSLTIASKQSIDDEKWHHLALVIERKTITLYVDGFLAQSVNNMPSLDNYDDGIVFGRHSGMSNITGEMDDVRFWNTARSIESIRDNMFACQLKDKKGLLFHYDFSEVDSVKKTIKDVSGNNANAIYGKMNVENRNVYHTPYPCFDVEKIKEIKLTVKNQLQIEIDAGKMNDVVSSSGKSVETATINTITVLSNTVTKVTGKSSYEGPYVNGKKHGKGKYTFESGNIYEGDFVEGKFNGKGKMTYVDGTIYEGDFLNDVYEGKGVYLYPSGAKYEGDYKNGKRNGNGTYTYKSGSKYVGGFKDGLFEGEGTMFYINGKVEKCIYAQDKCVTPIK